MFDDDFDMHHPYGHKYGQFGAGHPQPVNRRNPKKGKGKSAMAIHHEQGISLADAWAQVKARHNPNFRTEGASLFARDGFGVSVPPRYSQYDQVIGQFGPGHPQPVNRRNPRALPNMAGRPGKWGMRTVAAGTSKVELKMQKLSKAAVQRLASGRSAESGYAQAELERRAKGGKIRAGHSPKDRSAGTTASPIAHRRGSSLRGKSGSTEVARREWRGEAAAAFVAGKKMKKLKVAKPRSQKRSGAVKVSFFDKPCCVCGHSTKGLEICDSGKRGPKGGVQWKHVDC